MINTGELSVIQRSLLKRLEVDIGQQDKSALKDVFFPLHDENKLKGNLFEEEAVFQKIFELKRDKYKAYKRVKLKTPLNFDKDIFLEELKFVARLFFNNPDEESSKYKTIIKDGTNLQLFETFIADCRIKHNTTPRENKPATPSKKEGKDKKGKGQGHVETDPEIIFRRLCDKHFFKTKEADLLSREEAAYVLQKKKKMIKEAQTAIANLTDVVTNPEIEALFGKPMEINVAKPIEVEPPAQEINEDKPEQGQLDNKTANLDPAKSKDDTKKMKFQSTGLDSKNIRTRAQFIKFQSKRENRYRHNRLQVTSIYWPLETLFQIYILRPWRNNAGVLLHYFGEKITLYFKFTSFFLTYLIPIMIIGALLWGYQFAVYYFSKPYATETNDLMKSIETILCWLFGFVIIIWSGIFYYRWSRKELEYALKTGTFEDENYKERVGFKYPIYERSLINDHLNNKRNEDWVLYSKLVISILITFICYGISFGITIGFLFAKNAIIDNIGINEDWLYINHNIMNILEIVKMQIFDIIFYNLAIKLILWVDPKFMKEFENYLIMLLTIFAFFNHFFIMILLIFFKSYM